MAAPHRENTSFDHSKAAGYFTYGRTRPLFLFILNSTYPYRRGKTKVTLGLIEWIYQQQSMGSLTKQRIGAYVTLSGSAIQLR